MPDDKTGPGKLASGIAGVGQGVAAASLPGSKAIGNAITAGSRLFEENETGYIPGVSEAIYNAITPFLYPSQGAGIGQVVDAFSRVVKGEPGELTRPAYVDKESEDAWKLYLGLPQDNKTFKPAKFKPSKASDPNAQYFEMDRKAALKAITDQGNIKNLNEVKPGINSNSVVLGNFTIDKGEDEKGRYIAYYDKWDLATPFAKHVKVGKPFEIYGRIYYDENGKPIDEETDK